ncbi:MAG: 16S rRNA processing protein RimM [Schwartzia sp.]|nr:16S rRNA processing protein RimM [Schwartzia sp. (in: firmicutes)]
MEKSSPSAAEKRIIIGKAGAPHGVKGELKIIPMTDFPDRFSGMTHCYIGDTFIKIKSVRYQKNHVLMTVEGISSREEAAILTGAFVSVDRSEAVPLAKGEYYTADIIGLSVWDTDGQLLGTVADVLRTGSNDVYVVSLPGRREDILVPALKKVVLEISIEEGKMVVSMPEVVE